ncbi:MAG: site-specific integrase [Planctomycetota bacterium]
MPRKTGKVPSYCRHRHSGQAVVRIDRVDNYLGTYGSPQSHRLYERLIAEWRVRRLEGTPAPNKSRPPSPSLTLEQVVHQYRAFAQTYYVKDGKRTKEYVCMKYALRPLRSLYGDSNVADFGPLALKAVRQHMVDADLSRGVINNRVNRIKRFFKWAASEELVPAAVYQAVQSLSALRFGRTEARETEPVRPIDDEWVEAVLPSLSPQVAAMVRLQRICGMRPCEVVLMRACDIDMSGSVWIYEPFDHKNRWRGHRRLIPLGPRSQEILKPFLKLQTESFFFSPREAEAWRNEKRRNERTTPMTPSQAKRKPKKSPRRAKRERYDTDSYRRAITYAIKMANRKREEKEIPLIPDWYPLQLRHSRATEVRKGFGLEAAQVAMGHAHANVTEIYAERNLDLAIQIAQKIG